MNKDTKLPETLNEAIIYFSNPAVALEFVKNIRWPDGKVKCPRCGSADVSFTAKRRVWTCEDCPKREQFSVNVGTIMEESHLPLDKWLAAFWLMASAKNGISSYEIARALKVTQKTAWFLEHRIRLALKSGSLEKMSGETEADERLESTFNQLADQWRNETGMLSIIQQKAMHPAYQRIIGIGKPALPLILKSLERKPEHWLWALRAISGEEVATGIGDFKSAVSAWLVWGKQKGYL
ncbi:MAG: IS1595 family transposase [Verrucomicrobiota bacterium]|jgi:transposase-like protein